MIIINNNIYSISTKIVKINLIIKKLIINKNIKIIAILYNYFYITINLYIKTSI